MPDSDLSSIEKRLNDRIAHVEQSARLRVKSTDRAVKLAAKGLRARLKSMNEIRAQLTDQANRMATRESVEAVNNRINSLIWFFVVALAGLVTAFVLNRR